MKRLAHLIAVALFASLASAASAADRVPVPTSTDEARALVPAALQATNVAPAPDHAAASATSTDEARALAAATQNARRLAPRPESTTEHFPTSTDEARALSAVAGHTILGAG